MGNRTESFKRLLLENKSTKLLSLVLAAITWYSIRDTISFEVVVPDIRLDIQVKEGTAILYQSATTADVTFRGSQEDIQLIDPRRIRVVVDLRGNSAGSEQVPIAPDRVEGARGVRAVVVKPNTLMVTLDRESEKRVQVRGMFSGKPLLGQVESVTCDPVTVELRGPAGKLAATDFVRTEPVDVDGRIQSFAKRIRVLPPSDTWVAHIEPPDVQVKVNIEEKAAEREWKDVPVLAVITQRSPIRVEIQPSKVNLMLYGRSEMLERIEGNDVRVLVDCASLVLPGEYDVPVYVRTPTEMEVTAATDPERVHVVLKQP